MEAAGEELTVGDEHVAAQRGALEAVQHHDDRRALVGRRREVQVEEIAVRRLEPLAA